MKSKALAGLAGLFLLPLATPAVHAAESYDNCTGFITTLPAVITTQGTWCMDKDLSTSLGSGVAISIQTNNVTLDCNDYKLGGLAAGITTATVGIQSNSRLNATIRNCNVRGFSRGISFLGSGSGGHLVEDNRIEASTSLGIYMGGAGNSIRRNRILDTGGTPAPANVMGLHVNGDSEVIDNTIDGVTPSTDSSSFGVYGAGIQGSSSSVVQGNRVFNLDGGNGQAIGIMVYGGLHATLDRNILGAAMGASGTRAVYCLQGATLTGNLSQGFDLGQGDCSDDGGNIHK